VIVVCKYKILQNGAGSVLKVTSFWPKELDSIP